MIRPSIRIPTIDEAEYHKQNSNDNQYSSENSHKPFFPVFSSAPKSVYHPFKLRINTSFFYVNPTDHLAQDHHPVGICRHISDRVLVVVADDRQLVRQLVERNPFYEDVTLDG